MDLRVGGPPSHNLHGHDGSDLRSPSQGPQLVITKQLKLNTTTRCYQQQAVVDNNGPRAGAWICPASSPPRPAGASASQAAHQGTAPGSQGVHPGLSERQPRHSSVGRPRHSGRIRARPPVLRTRCDASAPGLPVLTAAAGVAVTRVRAAKARTPPTQNVLVSMTYR